MDGPSALHPGATAPSLHLTTDVAAGQRNPAFSALSGARCVRSAPESHPYMAATGLWHRGDATTHRRIRPWEHVFQHSEEAELSRKVFDVLTSTAGAVVVVVLLVAGGLLTWGHSFVNSNVHDQLAQQQISFPTKAAFSHPRPGTEITPSMIPSVSQYAGQPLLTGQQAKVYADDFMAVHLSEMPFGGVYSKISAAALASPSNAQLQTLKQTSFTGTTLRGLLLEAYAFSTIGEVMLWGAIASFILAAVMLLLTGVGFWHARRTPRGAAMLAPEPALAHDPEVSLSGS